MPSVVAAALGSKFTLNGNGWVFSDSVNARSSMGADGSVLTLKAQCIRAVFTNTDLLKCVSWEESVKNSVLTQLLCTVQDTCYNAI
jgi:hypothetical protein